MTNFAKDSDFAKDNDLNNIAVIVGINQYCKSERKFGQLSNAAKDARDLANLLYESYQYNVHLFIDDKLTDDKLTNDKQSGESFAENPVREPTLNEIKNFLKQDLPDIVKRSKPLKTCILFYFAGHGLTEKSDKHLKGFLIPQDAIDDDRTTWLEMTTVYTALAESGCHHVLEILDSCYSGASLWATRKVQIERPKLYKEQLQRYLANKTQMIMYSAAYDQEASDGSRGSDEESGNSPFAKALLNGLKNTSVSHKGIITATQLFVEIQKTLFEKALQEPGIRTPQEEFNGREYVFYNPEFDGDLDPVPAINEQNNPYRGLQAFEQRHAAVFCGRTALTKELCDRLYQSVTANVAALKSSAASSSASAIEPSEKLALPLTIVLGNSGSGKSSLVKAGVLPLLRQIQFAQSWKAAQSAEAKRSIFRDYADTHRHILEILGIKETEEAALRQSGSNFPVRVRDFLSAEPGKAAAILSVDWQILDPIRPGDKPLMSLARAFLPIDQPDLLHDEGLQSLNQCFKQLLEQWEMQQEVDQATLVPEQIQYAQYWEKTAPEARLLIVRDYYDSENHRFNIKAIEDLVLPTGVSHFYKRIKTTLDELYQRLEEDSQKENPAELAVIVQKWQQRKISQFAQSKILLVIDQLEELLTLDRPDKAKDLAEKSVSDRFLNTILAALKAHADRFQVIMTLRSDFEPRFFTTPLKDWLPYSRFPVRPMSAEELRQAIEEPAKAYALEFKPPSLVSQLIEELGQPGALPLLSFVLSELYLELKERQPDHEHRALVLNEDNQRGGIAGFLSQRADTEYEKLKTDFGEAGKSYQAMMQKVMLRMVTIEEGGGAKRRVRESELVYLTEQENQYCAEVIDRLVKARLLVKGRDEGEPYYEPAHDYLISGWARLQDWIAAEKQDLVLQRRLTPEAKEWTLKQKSNPPSGVLAKGTQVIEVFDQVLAKGEQRLIRLPQLAVTQTVARSQKLWQQWQKDRVQKDRERSNDQQQSLLPDKPKQLLWHTNPYLSVLDEELKSDDTWLNQFETEFVQQSVLQKHRNTRWWWRSAITLILILSGLTIAALIGQRNALVGQIRAARQSAEANLLSDQELDALVSSLQAAEELQTSTLLRLFPPNDVTQSQVKVSLQKAIDRVKERNRIRISGGGKAAVFSPDGRQIAIVQNDNTISLWDRTGKPLPGFKPFSATGRNAQFTQPGQDEVQDISFSPDGQQLVTVNSLSNDSGRSEVVRKWDLNGNPIGEDLPQPGIINRLMIGSNGSLMIFSNTDRFSLRELESGTPIAEFPNENSSGYEQFSPDGQLIAVSGSGIWNVNSNRQILELKDFPFFNSNKSVSVRFSPDSQLIAAGGYQDDTIYLWDLNGNQLAKFKANQGGIEEIRFSPDGKQLASVGVDGTLRIWQALQGKQLTEFSTAQRTGYRGVQDCCNDVSLSSNRQFIATSDTQGFQVRNLSAGKEVAFAQPFTNISEANFSPDSSLLALSEYEGTIRLLDLTNGQQVSQFQGNDMRGQGTLNPRQSQGISFSQDNQWIAIGLGDNVVVRTVQSQNEQPDISFPEDSEAGTPEMPGAAVQATAFDPSGRILATAAAGRVRLWDWQEGRQLLSKPIEANRTLTRSIVFSPQGNLIATEGFDGSSTNGIYLWNLSGQQVAEFKGHLGTVYQVIFSPDGSLLATAGEDGTARVWNLSGEQLAEFKGIDPVKSIAFSEDGKQLVAASEDGEQWATAGLKRVRTWQIENLNDLLVQGCHWAKDYLANSPNVSDSDRHTCDNIGTAGISDDGSAELSAAASSIPLPPLPCHEPLPLFLPDPRPGYYKDERLSLGDQRPGYYKDGEKYGLVETTAPPDGRFTLIFRSGDRYDGNFRNGKRNGCGTYTFASGNRYVGEFSDDQFQGQGEYFGKNGKVYRGEFANGKCHGRGILMLADGTSKAGEWQNGSLVGGSQSGSCDR